MTKTQVVTREVDGAAVTARLPEAKQPVGVVTHPR
jgi:hypothetical protein